MRYLVGNWKSYHTISQTHLWLSEFSQAKYPRSNLTAVVCVPFTNLAEANRLINGLNLPLITGAQNVSEQTEGRHTGEITATMLTELTRFCLVGHSERRRQFAETSISVAQKVKRLLEVSLIPIICVDKPYLEEQIKELLHLQLPLSTCIFAYEPVSAIGTGKAEEPDAAEIIAGKISFLTESQCPILYGGSVSPENIGPYLARQHLDGVLVGSDSLTVSSFIKLMEAFA